MKLAELQKLFNQYLHEYYGGQLSRLVTTDGKTLRDEPSDQEKRLLTGFSGPQSRAKFPSQRF